MVIKIWRRRSQTHNGWGVYSDNKQIVEGFITEKTFKAYYYELSVLVVGLSRTYMHLRSLGYTTFQSFGMNHLI